MNKISHVCIVDDDELFQFVMRQHFEKLGQVEHILQFPDGGQALAYIKAHLQQPELLPRLLLLDVNMPYMNGWEFMQEFTQLQLPQSTKINVYILTSSTHDSDLQKAKEYSQLSGYLVKPIGKSVINRLVTEILEPGS